MSRAFVKEDDGDDGGQPLARVHGEGPNYITPAGLERLRARIAALTVERDETRSRPDDMGRPAAMRRIDDELEWLAERVRRAVVVPTPAPPHESVGIGATATLLDEDARRHVYTVVGDDESDPAAGRISWCSPLGRELLGKAIGEIVTWRRPAGDLELEIAAIDYPAANPA